MARILHCDCCKVQDGSTIGPFTEADAVRPIIKVWHGVIVHGKAIDICHVCLGKVEAILGFELFDKNPKPTPKKKAEANNLECGKCHHEPHKPNDCKERVCDAAGDIDWCPC
jgi:hypothetical protein